MVAASPFMSRFFAFGDSFTDFKWSTWADIYGTNFTQYQNWGIRGSGNTAIHTQLVECILKKKIKQSDTIGIVWSSVFRLDAHNGKHWQCHGNVYKSPWANDRYTQDWDIEGFLRRDLATIHSARKLLDSTGCKYFMSAIMPFNLTKEYEPGTMTSDFLKLYDNTIQLMGPTFVDVLYNGQWSNMNQPYHKMDRHPGPGEHLTWLQTVCPEFTIKPDTKMLVDMEQKCISNLEYDTRKDFHSLPRPRHV